MGGMSRGIPTGSHVIVSAFYSTLVHQLLAMFCVVLVAVLAWNAVRTAQFRRAVRAGTEELFSSRPPLVREPAARAVLRWSFGALWLLDGLLQLQSSMPVGLPSGVIAPAASGSPSWVVDLVRVAVTTWTNHPVAAAAAAVWVQVGIGVLLLVAPRGVASRLAGATSAAWGLVVWVFGEAFGGLFVPHGASVLFGYPGAAVIYVVAGVLVALPESAWRTGAIGRRLLQALGVFFVAGAVLQAWPGSGFWQGNATRHSAAGALPQMVTQMASTPQPSVLRSALNAFGGFDGSHGFAVNLLVVVCLGAIGVALCSGRTRLMTVGVVAALVLVAADWLFVQDLGFLGGVGTDPNSMPPLAALLTGGLVAVRRPSAGARDVRRAVESSTPSWLDRATPGYLLQLTGAACAAVGVLLGAAPMALAATNPTADPILEAAIGASPQPVDYVAAPFDLVDAAGHRVSLAEERGKVVVLTFLDPVCSSDCPLIAQRLAAADRDLGVPRDVEFVAIDVNPLFRSTAALRAFDAEESLNTLPNWRYLTGTLGELRATWTHYGVLAALEPAGAMVDHSDAVYVIDQTGSVRDLFEPALGSSGAESSSFGALLAQTVRNMLAQ